MPEILNGVLEKAHKINIDSRTVGTFAEIGGGQEVARWFFHAGKAAATVAKSISAYDMAVSDGLYGPTAHYVSRERLEAMLTLEFSELVSRLGPIRGNNSAFFAFADTAATNTHGPSGSGHSWMGIRFQATPGCEPSEIIIHLEMLDPVATDQQETLGIAGVNLIYGACYYASDPNHLTATLLDGLARRRIQIDMIKFSGPAFAGVDNRLMSLQLVEQGLTDAAMFTADGEAVQPAEILYKKPVLIERGGFRPVTNVSLEMLNRSVTQLREDGKPVQDFVILMEMTLKNLMSEQAIDHRDFLARVDILGALGNTVMISNYTTFDRVTSYLRQYTQNTICMVMGVPTLRQVLDPKYYSDYQGGILEGVGRLFKGDVKLFVYPTRDSSSGKLTTAEDFEAEPGMQHLYRFLLDNGFIEPIRDFDPSELETTPAEVLAKIRAGDTGWEKLVPPPAASLIRERRLFGYAGETPAGYTPASH
ncbi:MAG: TonB-dependent receptor [Bryobacteraceae bacterium]